MEELTTILVGILMFWTILLTTLVILIGMILLLLYHQVRRILKRIDQMASQAEDLTLDLRHNLRSVLAGLLVFGLRQLVARFWQRIRR